MNNENKGKWVKCGLNKVDVSHLIKHLRVNILNQDVKSFCGPTNLQPGQLAKFENTDPDKPGMEQASLAMLDRIAQAHGFKAELTFTKL